MSPAARSRWSGRGDLHGARLGSQRAGPRRSTPPKP
ncbi:MAG: DUF1580 domain-containing protein, partial [Thermomicrobiaceae bacterium]|nr:DUF1580 domain-containing protein [Thermomicrobiaceae bacterium]